MTIMDKLDNWRWHWNVLIHRHGLWPLPGVLFLVLTLLMWLLWLPAEGARVQAEIEGLSAQSASAGVSKSAQTGSGFNLPAEVKASDSVQHILQMAKEYGLAVAQADYKRHADGHVGRWQVQLPVTASYPQIRRFLRATRDIPGLSLDELGFRGSDTGAGVDARLSFSIWFEMEKPASPVMEGAS